MQIKHFLVILSVPQRNTKFSTPMRLLDHIRECFGEGGMSVVLLKECEASWKGICRVCGASGAACGEVQGAQQDDPGCSPESCTSVHICTPGLPLVPPESSRSCVLSWSSSDFCWRCCAVTDHWLLPGWDSVPDQVRTDGPPKPAFSQILSSTCEFSSYFLTLKIYTPTTSWLSLAIPLMKNQDAKRY